MRQKQYHNPVLGGFHPDPSVCRVNDNFYLVTSTFEYFPGVPVFHSKNLVNWQCINHCLTTRKQLDLENCHASSGIYAPTIRYHDGTFYMVTTNVHKGRNFFVYTNDITGTWSDPIFVDQGGIDPSLLFAQDKVYFCSNGLDDNGRQAIYLCEIDIKTGEKKTSSRIISYGSGGKYPEAPHLYEKDGWFYLMLAEGGTEYGHMVTIFRAKNPWGPFESCPHNPILTHRNEQNNRIQATGHADLIQDQNESWWMVCLGIRTNPKALLHHLGRETFLAPVQWNGEWPIVGDGGVLHETMTASLPGPEPVQKATRFETSFTEIFDPRWTYIRNPDCACYLTDENGLHLRANGKLLSDSGANPAFLGIRQGALCCRAQVQIAIPDEVGARCGISAFYNNDYHFDLYITRTPKDIQIGCFKRLHDMQCLVFSKTICYTPCDGDCMLQIDANELQYTFSYKLPDKPWEIVATGLTAALSTETTHTMTFTGVLLGLYCEKGEGIFRHFIYEEYI